MAHFRICVPASRGESWQVVELSDFEADEPLAKWLMTARPGDISDPLDLEDGISIVGLRMVYDDEEDEGESPEKQYSLVRCAFHAFQEFEEVEDRDNWGIAVIGENTVIAEGAVVKAKEMIDSEEVAGNEK